uniref:Uncharacterized protein n=1 Tax=Panagrolaimus superbus TaxID=310955 RepID=A0A914Z644_9BILA
MVTKHAIIVFGFIASLCYGLEYLKGKNGDPWNSWGNGDSKINDEIDGIDDNEAKILPPRKNNFRQCVKPWQKAIMTLATISKPAEAITCHPDFKPCGDEKAECQFSFSTFQYICCKDRDDMKPPECPKYYTTLRTLCGGINEASCPRNFKCMASRFDPNIEICCRPNASIIYPEPDTSFRDNFIVPEYLPVSPVTTVTLQFKSLDLAAGQLISNDDIDDLLSEPPTIKNFQGDSSKFYTIMLFGFPRNAPAFVKEANKATLYHLMHNLSPTNGTLFANANKRTTGKEVFSYLRPLRDEKPFGRMKFILELKLRWRN